MSKKLIRCLASALALTMMTQLVPVQLIAADTTTQQAKESSVNPRVLQKVNVAQGASVSSNVDFDRIEKAVDGVIELLPGDPGNIANYKLSDTNDPALNPAVYVQLDLGKSYAINQIDVFRMMWPDESHAQYQDVIVQIADNPEFTDAITIFNNDEDNSAGVNAGLPLGKNEYDVVFNQPSTGQKIVLGQPVEARYVRLWSRGNYWVNKVNPNNKGYNGCNTYAEIEVWSEQDITLTKNVTDSLVPISNGILTNGELITDGSTHDRVNTFAQVSSGTDGYDNYENNEAKYIQFDFGKPFDLSQIKIFRNMYLAADAIYRDVKVEVSNDPFFNTSEVLFEGTDLVEQTTGQIIDIKNLTDGTVNAQYIRIWSKGHEIINHAPSTWKGYSAANRYAEVQVLAENVENEPEEGMFTNVALGKTVTAVGTVTGKEYANDGKFDTNKMTITNPNIQSFVVDFGKSYNTEKVQLMGQLGEVYDDVKIYLSSDNTFTEDKIVHSVASYIEKGMGLTTIFTPQKARYMKVEVANNESAAFVEVSAYGYTTALDGKERRNIALGKIPATSGKGITNGIAISDGQVDGNYAVQESHGTQWMQFDFKHDYPISEIRLKGDPNVAYESFEVSLSRNPIVGHRVVFSETNYTPEDVVIKLDQPIEAGHVRIKGRTQGSETKASFEEVEIIALLDEGIELDETPDAYVPPSDTLYNELVWSDEFNGEVVDESKWQIIHGFPNYAAIYNREAVSIVKGVEEEGDNGYLNINSSYVGPEFKENPMFDDVDIDAIYPGRIKPNDAQWNGTWSSGRVESKNKFSFQNGRMAVRAKVNDSQGIWPAIWMLAQDEKASNEIDILEYLGQEKYTHYATNHYGAWGLKGHGSHGGTYNHYEPLSSDFHVYEVEWREDVIIFYFDGKEAFRTARPQGMHNRPMFPILETQVGGGWVGNVDPTFNNTQESSDYQIDWIRVYQNEESSEVVFDDLEDFSQIVDRSDNLRVATEDMQYFQFGGQPRVENSRLAMTTETTGTHEYIVYEVDGLRDFHATTYYGTVEGETQQRPIATQGRESVTVFEKAQAAGKDPNFKFYTAENKEGPWTEVDAVREEQWIDSYPYYARKIFDGYNMPEGTKYLKIEFPDMGEYYDKVQLSKVTMTTDKQEKVELTLQGNDVVNEGETVEVLVGMNNPLDAIYAMDSLIAYDENLFELDSIIPIEVDLFKEEGYANPLRVLLAKDGGITNQAQLLALSFRAKDVNADRTGIIEVKDSIAASVVEGIDKVSSIDNVQKSVTVKAEIVPEGDKEDINKDEKIDVADLALVAYYYKAKLGDTNWEEAKKADINGNKEIDIQDLSLIAGKILEKQ